MPGLLLKLAGPVIKLFGAFKTSASSSTWGGLGLLVACLLPLLLFQCSNSKLENMRARYNALEAEHQAAKREIALVGAALERCRQNASVQEAVLLKHQKDVLEINSRYNALREEVLNGAFAQINPKETNNDHAEAPAGQSGGAFDQDYQAWCAQPLPLKLRGLLGPASRSPILP